MMLDPTADAFRRQDESDDSLFYGLPRLVAHIDDHAIASLTALYRRLLPPDAVILDLMSSRYSHLPFDLPTAGVMGLGMNAFELSQNPQLDQFVVHDLNLSPMLPFESAVFDAVVCAVSVQYLTRPVAVFREVNRALKPGGIFIAAFSNRCYPTKAVAAWLNTDDRGHVALVTHYFDESGGWDNMNTLIAESAGHDPLYVVWARRLQFTADQNAAQTE